MGGRWGVVGRISRLGFGGDEVYIVFWGGGKMVGGGGCWSEKWRLMGGVCGIFVVDTVLRDFLKLNGKIFFVMIAKAVRYAVQRL